MLLTQSALSPGSHVSLDHDRQHKADIKPTALREVTRQLNFVVVWVRINTASDCACAKKLHVHKMTSTGAGQRLQLECMAGPIFAAEEMLAIIQL